MTASPGSRWAPWMERALGLAERARGETSPNPLVGALIVRGDRVLGEGWHHRAGGPHAEIEALADAARRGEDVRGATMVVTLEPCRHTGRTGPCTRAIIEAGLGEVVIAALDPNPLVAGQGAVELESAGLRVHHGILESFALHQNRIFFHWIRTNTPFTTLKLAQTLDARIAAREGAQTAISGAEAHARVMALRAHHDAILVGRRTVAIDDPRLTIRGLTLPPAHRPPWRLVADSQLRLDPTLRVFGHDGRAIALAAESAPPHRVAAFTDRGIRVIQAGPQQVDLAQALASLAGGPTPITSVLCEGGSALAASLLSANAVHEVILHLAPTFLGATGVPAIAALTAPSRWSLTSTASLGADLELTLHPEK